MKKSWICAYRDHNHFDTCRIQNRHAFTTPLRIVVHGNDIFPWRFYNKPVKMALKSRRRFHWSASFACKTNSYSNCTLNIIFIVMIFFSTFYCKLRFAQKMEFSNKVFFSKIWTYRKFPADLVAFIKLILIGKLNSFWSATCHKENNYLGKMFLLLQTLSISNAW